MLPAIAVALGKEYSVREGWLTGTLNRVVEESDETITLGICFPTDMDMGSFQNSIMIEGKSIQCYGFYENLNTPERYDGKLEERFSQILEDFQPDMIHIFGTEFPHGLAMAKVWNQPEKTLVGLQGIISECAKVYMADLPEKVQKKVTFRDWLKKDSLKQQQEKFVVRGEREIQLLKKISHVTGRTVFDQQASSQINKNVSYHKMNETMRENFYQGKWELERCEKHRIFVSQGDYPLKGLHYVIEALEEIKKEYPDVKVVVAGNSIMNSCKVVASQNKGNENARLHLSFLEKAKGKIKISAYGNYLDQMVKDKKLKDNIEILGRLSEEEMKGQYLRCHTFICASSLENSPNSVAEAMLLGVPVVGANVGGVPDMIKNQISGIVYESRSRHALSESVLKLWADESLQKKIAAEAKKQAIITHNPQKNYERLLEIYSLICEGRK